MQNSSANVNIGVGALAWLFLTHMGVPQSAWHTLLFPFGGNLPVDDEQFNRLVAQVKTTAYLPEHTHAGPRTLEEGWRSPATTSFCVDDGWDPADADPPASAGQGTSGRTTMTLGGKYWVMEVALHIMYPMAAIPRAR